MDNFKDMYKPDGWNESDMLRASAEMEAFTKTFAFAWMDHHVSTLIERSQRVLVPSRPEEVPHGKFIAESARCRAYECFHDAATYLTNWKPEKRNDDEQETTA